MALYYVVPRKDKLDVTNHGCYHNRGDAIANAEKLHERTGNHFHVVEVNCVHTTTTLAEVVAEIKAEEAAKAVAQ